MFTYPDVEGLLEIEVDIGLWEGDYYPFFIESIIDLDTKITLNLCRFHHPLHLNPKMHFEFESRYRQSF